MINPGRRELLRLQVELDDLRAMLVRAEATGTAQPELQYIRCQIRDLERRIYG